MRGTARRVKHNEPSRQTQYQEQVGYYLVAWIDVPQLQGSRVGPEHSGNVLMRNSDRDNASYGRNWRSTGMAQLNQIRQLF